MSKVNNKNTNTTTMDVVLVSLIQTLSMYFVTTKAVYTKETGVQS